MNADGTGLHQLGFGHSPAWSRDSVGRIAFFKGTPYGETLTITNADGSGVDRDLRLPGFTLSLADLRWSPDGRTFAFHASDEEGLPGLVPVELDRVLLIDADGSNLRPLDAYCADCSYGGGEVSPAWSPDGTTLLYWIYAAPLFAFATVEPRPGTHSTLLWTLPTSSWPEPRRLDWSPDGRWIVYRRSGALWVVPYPGGITSTRLSGTEQALNPTWTR
jgi:Tol biopolymer transport system component